jgi:hypothetical protein
MSPRARAFTVMVVNPALPDGLKAFLVAAGIRPRCASARGVTRDGAAAGSWRASARCSGQYPDLKAVQSFVQIQARVSDVESKIADCRETFNDAVNIYNIQIERFPDLILAAALGYKRQQFLDRYDEVRKQPWYGDRIYVIGTAERDTSGELVVRPASRSGWSETVWRTLFGAIKPPVDGTFTTCSFWPTVEKGEPGNTS